MSNSDYTIPSYITSTGDFANTDQELLKHLGNVIESSKAFLRSNRAWPVAEICRKILYGDDKQFNSLSRDTKIEINKLRRQGREIIGNASNIRPNFSIRTAKSDNSANDKTATYEQLKDHWWYSRFIDRKFKEAAQEAASGIGYLFVWPRKDPNTREWEIEAHAKSYKEVFPYQIGADNDLDKAYSVTIWCELPIAEARELVMEFAPAKSELLKADRNAPSYIGRKFKRAKEAWSGIRNIINSRRENKTETLTDPSFPTIDIFYTFTRDDTINISGKDIMMGTLINGDLAGHDSYKVPSYIAGVNTKEDCRLFPNRRLTIWTKDRILFDGAPKWITDCVPVAEIRYERLPKEYIGVPVLNDGRSLELAINRMINSIIDRFKAKAEFPIAYDENLPRQVKALLQSGGLRALVGKGLAMNLRQAGDPIRALFKDQLFDVDQKEFEIIKSLMELQDYIVGTNDFSNLQRKNQVPGADTQEALLQNQGALSVDNEREISIGIHKFGRIFLYLAPQIYNLKKRVTIIGANALDLRDIDYDPENLVPKLDPKFSDEPYWKRLKNHIAKFNLFAMPGSLQERQSITNKLTLLQVQKAGGTISDKKIYDAFIPDGRYEDTKKEWEAEQIEKAKLAAQIRKEVEAIAGSANSPEGGNMLQQLISQLNQNTSGQGRPPENATLPRLETKKDEEGITRATSATYN